ncbi:PH domain-containing protein [Cellulomonas sp. HZM]|uniref:PH domain-containing protein n=1 Tax=Cellulomonas sp. HZM TaxID=1454010 RepID=UPI000A7CF84B|nr:PH domain-containing protein [Cellulomonas sp. HZM]
MIEPTVLDDALASRWVRRVPVWTTRWLLPLATLVVGILAISLPGGEVWTAAQVADGTAQRSAALVGFAAGAVVVSVWRPAWGVWLVAATGALGTAWPPSVAVPAAWWAVLGLVAAVVGVLDAAAAAHQRVVARSSGMVVVPDVDDDLRRLMLRPRVGVLAVGVVALVGVAPLTGLYHHDLTSAQEFRAAAVHGTGTVTKVDDDGFWFDADVDGRTIRVSENSLSASVGDEVPVTYLPDGSRAERTDDAFDPTGPLVAIAVLLLVAVTAFLVELDRRARAHRLLRNGGVAWRVAVAPSSSSRLDVAPLDAPHRVVAQLALTTTDERVDGARDGAAGGPGGIDGTDGSDENEHDDERPTSELSDHELLAWLRDMHREGEDDEDDEDWHRPSDTEAVVVGLDALGDRPVVQVDGAWWASRFPARERMSLPWSAAGRRARGPLAPGMRSEGAVERERRLDASLSERGPAGREHEDPAGEPRSVRVLGVAARVLRRTPLVVPFAVAPIVFVAARWLFAPPDGPGWVALIGGSLGTAALGGGWVERARPRLRITRAGLRTTGPFVDRTIAWADVTRVLTSEDGLVVRTTDDAFGVPFVPDVSPPLLAGDPDVTTAAHLLEEARRGAGQASGPSATTPSLAALAGLAWVAALVGGALSVLL